MRGNSFGTFLTLTTFGESHGAALGAVIDGCPAGIPLAVEDFTHALRRRRPGQSDLVSPRRESDTPELLSGVFQGVTLGTPIAVLVRNEDARSGDYTPGRHRPGHADRAWDDKYGVRDHRGGGRASGRETVGRVIGGVVAEKILPPAARIVGFTRAIGGITAADIPEHVTRELVDAHPTRCPDFDAAERMAGELRRCRERGDSRGGIAELRIDGLPAGLGEPVFGKTKARLTAALMSVGAVTGVLLGDAWNDVRLDGAVYHKAGGAEREGYSPRAWGIQGGITNGDRIVLQVLVKPPSTLGAEAASGRHDPCILPRIIPVLEAMAALTLADLVLAARLDRA
jgi:chorismate synthase